MSPYEEWYICWLPGADLAVESNNEMQFRDFTNINDGDDTRENEIHVSQLFRFSDEENDSDTLYTIAENLDEPKPRRRFIEGEKFAVSVDGFTSFSENSWHLSCRNSLEPSQGP